MPEKPLKQTEFPVAAAPGSDLQQIRAWIVAERDFNEKWIPLHELEKHPLAADHRRRIVAERDRWIIALDRVEAALLKISKTSVPMDRGVQVATRMRQVARAALTSSRSVGTSSPTEHDASTVSQEKNS